MTALDLDKLEALAKAAEVFDSWDAYPNMTSQELSAYKDAANPQVILELIAELKLLRDDAEDLANTQIGQVARARNAQRHIDAALEVCSRWDNPDWDKMDTDELLHQIGADGVIKLIRKALIGEVSNE